MVRLVDCGIDTPPISPFGHYLLMYTPEYDYNNAVLAALLSLRPFHLKPPHLWPPGIMSNQ